MYSEDQELFGEFPMCNLYIVSKDTSCYTLFRYLILRDTSISSNYALSEIHELFVTYYTYQSFSIGVRFT